MGTFGGQGSIDYKGNKTKQQQNTQRNVPHPVEYLYNGQKDFPLVQRQAQRPLAVTAIVVL